MRKFLIINNGLHRIGIVLGALNVIIGPPLLYDNFESLQFVENYEIDQDVKRLSYKFNKRLKEDKKYLITISLYQNNLTNYDYLFKYSP